MEWARLGYRWWRHGAGWWHAALTLRAGATVGSATGIGAGVAGERVGWQRATA
jgi:uncharacterized membrane protein YfcA